LVTLSLIIIFCKIFCMNLIGLFILANNHRLYFLIPQFDYYARPRSRPDAGEKGCLLAGKNYL
jgi:hypothetical protein